MIEKNRLMTKWVDRDNTIKEVEKVFFEDESGLVLETDDPVCIDLVIQIGLCDLRINQWFVKELEKRGRELFDRKVFFSDEVETSEIVSLI